ncbi:hypothetical protein LIA77_07710 [Sarocladium implicatum]|nr:hypothetical protein LIA77_07710 [Sarocladium implicatum]
MCQRSSNSFAYVHGWATHLTSMLIGQTTRTSEAFGLLPTAQESLHVNFTGFRPKKSGQYLNAYVIVHAVNPCKSPGPSVGRLILRAAERPPTSFYHLPYTSLSTCKQAASIGSVELYLA